jgi:hypothetical protein
MRRREFIALGTALPACLQAGGAETGWIGLKWKTDPRVVIPRGQAGVFDSQITGDPCVVWDPEAGTWRMFYFASSNGDPTGHAPNARAAGMALSRSAEEIGPGDWHKAGEAPIANPQDQFEGRPGHKWWVVMDPRGTNRAARIRGRYWAVMVSTTAAKHIQAAWAERLAGPWTVVPQPILSPGTEPLAPDGKHCDTPTAYWFEDAARVLVFYKAYPLRAQKGQPGSPFGSSGMTAWWRPGEALASKAKQILLPGTGGAWNRGWIGGLQLLGGQGKWYGLGNGSPTPPEDRSNREPAPSLGGWLLCDAAMPDSGWSVDGRHSPFLHPEQLTSEQLAAGLGVNFWRHHLLATPQGRARIFFNSGKYGSEQMFSLVAEAG